MMVGVWLSASKKMATKWQKHQRIRRSRGREFWRQRSARLCLIGWPLNGEGVWVAALTRGISPAPKIVQIVVVVGIRPRKWRWYRATSRRPSGVHLGYAQYIYISLSKISGRNRQKSKLTRSITETLWMELRQES